MTETPPGAVNDRIRYETELADEQDYWLTYTDAARVTRRQEITIRRWVATGQLPLKAEQIGVNKRSRHVRASDLAVLTPIIDAAAAITGKPANVSLMSIPEEQALLRIEQARLDVTVVRLRQELTTTSEHLSTTLATQIAAVQHLMESHTTDMVRQLAEHLALSEAWHHAAEQRAAEYATDMQDMRAAHAQQLAAERTERQQADDAARAQATRQEGIMTTLQDELFHLAQQQQEALTQLEDRITARLGEQQHAQVEQVIAEHAALVQQVATLLIAQQSERQEIRHLLANMQEQQQVRAAQLEMRLVELERQRHHSTRTVVRRRHRQHKI